MQTRHYIDYNDIPKIFEYFGFIFYFFSNEHEPIHVHVKHGGCESIFELIMENGKLQEIKRREKPGVDSLTSKEAATAIEFIQAYWQDIVAKSAGEVNHSDIHEKRDAPLAAVGAVGGASFCK